MKKNIAIADKRYLEFVREMKERITYNSSGYGRCFYILGLGSKRPTRTLS